MDDIELIKKGSVQVKDERNIASGIFRFIANRDDDELPPWWTPQRDRYFRDFWPTEPFLASAIYSIAARNAAYEYVLTGPSTDVQYSQNLLANAGFGKGWQSFISKLTTDLNTQDNGAFGEIIRPARVKINGELVEKRDQAHTG